MLKPYIGQIVLYHHPGSADGRYNPSSSPAVILRVHEVMRACDDFPEIDLMICSNFSGILFQKKVRFGFGGRMWSFNHKDELERTGSLEAVPHGLVKGIPSNLLTPTNSAREDYENHFFGGEDTVPEEPKDIETPLGENHYNHLTARQKQGFGVVKKWLKRSILHPEPVSVQNSETREYHVEPNEVDELKEILHKKDFRLVSWGVRCQSCSKVKVIFVRGLMSEETSSTPCSEDPNIKRC